MNRQITPCQLGTSSTLLPSPVYIQSCACVAGQKENEGPLSGRFDLVCKDPLFGSETWEAAESTMQKAAAELALKKAGISPRDVRMVFAGDLLAQTTASSFGIAGLGIPYYGLFGACSTMGESLSLGSMTVSCGFADRILCATSSHFCSAEKEFRFPLGYGNQRPLSATWTVTGSGACILGNTPPGESASLNASPLVSDTGCVKITGFTTGRVVDYGLKDSMNMGGCMAPAACDTIVRHLNDFDRKPADYDRIFTGDLGMVGKRILLDLLMDHGIDVSKRHEDCGLIIFDNLSQDTHSGGSGCGCSALVLVSYILPRLVTGEWHRILFVPTGALLSKTTFNEGDSIPGIAHGVVLEYERF